jgi:hypothetical protein
MHNPPEFVVPSTAQPYHKTKYHVKYIYNLARFIYPGISLPLLMSVGEDRHLKEIFPNIFQGAHPIHRGQVSPS